MLHIFIPTKFNTINHTLAFTQNHSQIALGFKIAPQPIKNN